MRCLFLLLLFLFLTPALKLFGVSVDLPELPKTPVSQLGMGQLSEVLSTNSTEAWNTIAEEAKQKALSLAQSGDIKQASNWLYTSLAASVCGREGEKMPIELKRIFIENIPVFFDFYESLTKYDSLSNACDVATQLFINQPAQAKKYFRATLALALIYDVSLPPNWPRCNVVDEPTQVSMPQEIFLYLTLHADKLAFDLNKLSIAELIHVMGLCGPLPELEKVFVENIKLREIENVQTSIKTDSSRARGAKSKDWDTTKNDFTLENIKRLGATPYEKTFYAWRLANANGIPCLFFNDSVRSTKFAWLAYMNGAGTWKFDVFRDPASKMLFGAPLNPQTWKPITMFDLHRLVKREHITEKSAQSIVLYRLAQLLSDAGKYALARDFAKKALEENPLNWRAYSLLIPSMARCGASSKELDEVYRQSFEAFKDFPEQSTKMLNLYRDNLIARKKAKEADTLFHNAMKPINRANPGLVAVLYGDVLEDMLSRAKSDSEALSVFKNVMRYSSKAPVQFYDYVAKPSIEYFWKKNDRKSAFAAIKITSSLARSNSYVENALNDIKIKFEDEIKLEKQGPTAEKKPKPFYE
ncbi:MAG: hypothetical protein E7035_00040 [Verrucomicrobiaceae bacterium]|nr:hypothetical protein [Verrucomicrobiaceae bacterium]